MIEVINAIAESVRKRIVAKCDFAWYEKGGGECVCLSDASGSERKSSERKRTSLSQDKRVGEDDNPEKRGDILAS